jgi:glyoxylase I family protein
VPTRFAHTNLGAVDLERTVDFYVEAFGCVRGVERVYDSEEASDALRRGTGVAGLRLAGVHLKLPGGGDATLEVLAYRPPAPRDERPPHAPGFGHVAFEVDDLDAMRARVVELGGSIVGEVVTVPYPAGDTLSWCYVRDPEGNVVELQSFARR